jgi:hypothetical protein
LISGSQLQIREKLVNSDKTIDTRQTWLVKTDGTIVSEPRTELGFALIQQGGSYHVQLSYISTTSTHYTWDFMHGHYESRYSEVYKKNVDVVVRTEKILLTIQTRRGNFYFLFFFLRWITYPPPLFSCSLFKAQDGDTNRRCVPRKLVLHPFQGRQFTCIDLPQQGKGYQVDLIQD